MGMTKVEAAEHTSARLIGWMKLFANDGLIPIACICVRYNAKPWPQGDPIEIFSCVGDDKAGFVDLLERTARHLRAQLG